MKQPLPRRIVCLPLHRQPGRGWPLVLGRGAVLLTFLLISPFSLLPFSAQAQVPGVSPGDTTKPVEREYMTKVKPAERDSAYIRDSTFYTNLKRRMEKRGFTRDLYNFLFRDVYNTNAQQQQVDTLDQNPFQTYSGRVIRHIIVRRLEVFGPSVYDTLRKPGSWFERVGNRLHTDTRESVIKKSFLLFKENDPLDPDMLRNNERLLRSSNIFHDARIVIIPEPLDPRVVDVLILTQDVWSLNPEGGIGGFNNVQLTLEQRNFRGQAHTFTNGFAYDGNVPDSVGRKFEFFSNYRIPYIARTFVTGEASLVWKRYQRSMGLSVYRPFLTPESKWAGSATLSYNSVRYQVFVDSLTIQTRLVPVNFALGDIWIGRAFKLDFLHGVSDDFKRRSRLIVALRATGYKFTRRPNVSDNENELYQNSRSLLFSLGFTNRDYQRDLLVYGFGRTEDVPIGYLAQIVIGPESAELGSRTYSAFRLARGGYLGRNRGYIYTLVNFGGFFRRGGVDQGVINAESNYFTPLMHWGRSHFRHFLNFRYTAGFNRYDYEFININNQNGLTGISSDLLRGTTRLTGGVESVFFTSLNLIGFRVAVFGFVNLGLVSYSNKDLFNGPLYQGYGLGIRLRNENLTFNTLQIRLGYYPNIPALTNRFRVDFSGETPLRFNDFNFDRPEYRSDGFLNSTR
ncbi:MAG: hypothetical protein H7Y12_08080 [Sphingobacteriaceae bacterium]|nr:hypothetical protein [Cytophagaceae bacterium]